jgi:FkbM family methyltransferase
MTFISYAQNFEDVVLWRALKHIAYGFYIDVGANDPSADSITKAFYDRGWHGINIEPLRSHHADLERERPRDVNLQCAAGASNGEIEVWECDVRGWASASQEVVAQHEKDGHSGTYHKVPILRLTDICAQYAPADIHFLKIDVEGFEKSVIDGIDFSQYRPWILVIEATKPNSTEENYREWEDEVISAGYMLGYADGLNRFYVASEHGELLNSLRHPPNVFDGFIRWEHLFSERRAQQAEARATQAEARAQQSEVRATQAESRGIQAEARATQAEARAQQSEVRATQAEIHTAELLNSTSWRITAPLRWASAFMRRLSRSAMKHQIETLLQHAALYINRRPRMKRLTLAVLNHFPGIRSRLFSVASGTTAVYSITPNVPTELAHLGPRARQIYTDLKAAIERQGKERG